MAVLDSVNIGARRRSDDTSTGWTGIGKSPQVNPVQVRAPGPRTSGLGSGLVGDFIGDQRHHGGDDQAVYAFSREDLDRWAARLGRDLPNGFFGENLTTRGIDVNEARLGERWRIGEEEVELVVTCPRIPCNTFRGWIGERGWLRRFTADARPGAYLAVAQPGRIRGGDVMQVVHRPPHDVTISVAFRALTTERELLPRLASVGEDLVPGLREEVAAAVR